MVTFGKLTNKLGASVRRLIINRFYWTMRLHHGLYHQRNFEKPELLLSMPSHKARPRFFCKETTPAPNNAVYVIAAGHRQIAARKADSGWPFSRPGGGMFFAFEIMTLNTIFFATRWPPKNTPPPGCGNNTYREPLGLREGATNRDFQCKKARVWLTPNTCFFAIPRTQYADDSVTLRFESRIKVNI